LKSLGFLTSKIETKIEKKKIKIKISKTYQLRTETFHSKEFSDYDFAPTVEEACA